MDDLTFGLKRLCARNRDGSHSTRANRSRILTQIASELREMGYRHLYPTSLRRKYVDALLHSWHARNLSAGTIKNRLCALRWWAEKVGRMGLIPADNAQLGIAARQFLTNENKARTLGDKLAKVSDEHVRMSLRLQEAFGLRREESIKFMPSYADRDDCIVLKGSWTKGGRERSIPISHPDQRVLLEQAHALTGKGSLIPAHKTYVEQLRLYEGQCKAAALSAMHGLRHAYAQSRYEALTGWKAPAAGGPPSRIFDVFQRALDVLARQIVSRELGHERVQITNVYLGK
jgi:integrase